ncbi:MAG: hypothetical protein GC192_15840 [Bacteroidetes bacterium]|nr:hypothetical protein [Bacteroidota bacterium]
MFASFAAVIGFVGVRWGERCLKQKIEDKIASYGVLTYGKMHFNLLAGNVSFENATINIKWEEQAKFFHVLTPEIRVEGIGWRRLYFDKKLSVASFHLLSPDVTVLDTPPLDTLTQAATEPPSDSVAASLLKVIALELQSVTLDGGCVEVFRGNKGLPQNLFAQANDINLDLKGIQLNLQGDVMNSLVFEDADVLLNYLTLKNRNSHHNFTLQQFHLNKQDSLIEVVNLNMTPKDNPSDFFKKLSFKKAWFDLRFPSVRLKGWKFGELLDGALVARSVDVADLDMKVRVTQNLQPDPNGYRPMPQELLRRIPMTIKIDSVVVSKSKLLFENIGPGKTEVGVITFDPLNIVFTNFTNDSVRIAQQKIMELDAVGYCKGKYPVYNHFWFDLANPAQAFSFKGHASKVPFVSLNSFIKPCTDVFFDDGTINSISFEANGDEKTANGSLQMDYEDFHFSLLNDDRERRKVLSKVVDLLFIKSANDNEKDDFQEGNIHARRDVRLSFLNYWWSAIQSGIKTSLMDGFALKRTNKRMANRAAK